MKSYQEIYREYLKSFVREADMWEKIYGDNTYDPTPVEEATYKTLMRANEATVRELTAHPDSEVHSISFGGCLKDSAPEEMSHYDIDQHLKAVFGDQYTADSESGQFFGYCDHRIADKVVEYVTNKYGDVLDFSVRDNRVRAIHFPADFKEFQVCVPGATNWTKARKSLAELEA